MKSVTGVPLRRCLGSEVEGDGGGNSDGTGGEGERLRVGGCLREQGRWRERAKREEGEVDVVGKKRRLGAGRRWGRLGRRAKRERERGGRKV